MQSSAALTLRGAGAFGCAKQRQTLASKAPVRQASSQPFMARAQADSGGSQSQKNQARAPTKPLVYHYVFQGTALRVYRARSAPPRPPPCPSLETNG